jgi:bilirubin oxidase
VSHCLLTVQQENAYFGQAGFYILHDAEERNSGLPQGDYDIPLAIASKRYNADFSLWSPDANQETTSLFGDVIHVNGLLISRVVSI